MSARNYDMIVVILRTLLHPRGPSSSSLEISSCPAMRATSSGVFRSSHQGTAVCWGDAPRICSRCASRTAMTHKSTSRPQIIYSTFYLSSTIFQRLWMHTDQTYPCSAAKGWRAHCIVWRTHPWPQPMQDQLNYIRSKLAALVCNPKCVNFIEFLVIVLWLNLAVGIDMQHHSLLSTMQYPIILHWCTMTNPHTVTTWCDVAITWYQSLDIPDCVRCLYVLDVWQRMLQYWLLLRGNGSV